jgi:ElaB/YqjD/DUF883 family membrane-anchored ribosome-binding protein
MVPVNPPKMKTAPDTNPPSSDEILEELRALIGEAEKILNASGDPGEPEFEDSLAALRERFESARERIAKGVAATRQQVAAGAHDVDTLIRENPYQSLAVAGCVGLLLGLLLSRRGD